MSNSEWIQLVGVMMAAGVVIAPAAAAVFIKISVMSARLTALDCKVGELCKAELERVSRCAVHGLELDQLDKRTEQQQRQLDDHAKRIGSLEGRRS